MKLKFIRNIKISSRVHKAFTKCIINNMSEVYIYIYIYIYYVYTIGHMSV